MYPPQALQILFPTSSLLQRGVVLVPQFAQQRAPTATRGFLLLPPPPTLASASLSIPGVVNSGSITAAGTTVSAMGESAAAATRAALAAAAFSSSIRAEIANALLNVGQPEQALVPPVPSQRPSPGQVPPEEDV